MPVHPTFLYESLWCLVGFVLLRLYMKYRRFNGDMALLYAIWYGAGRFWIEGLRTDSLLLVPSLGLRASQLLAAVAVVGGLIAELILSRRYRNQALMIHLAVTADNRKLQRQVAKKEGIRNGRRGPAGGGSLRRFAPQGVPDPHRGLQCPRQGDAGGPAAGRRSRTGRS